MGCDWLRWGDEVRGEIGVGLEVVEAVAVRDSVAVAEDIAFSGFAFGVTRCEQ